MKYALGTMINNGGSLNKNPANIAQGLMFWTKGQNLPRTSWNEAGHQLNNEVATLPPKPENRALYSPDAVGLNRVTHASLADVGSGTSDTIAVHCWARKDSGRVYFPSFTSGYLGIYLDGGTSTLVVRNSNLQSVAVTNSAEWHSYQVIYNSGAGTADVYQDGAFVSQITGITQTATAQVAQFGGVTNGGGEFNGWLKDFCVWKNPTFADEAAWALAMHEAGDDLISVAKSFDGDNLVGLYPCADYNPADLSGAVASGLPILDYSGNENHGTVQGSSMETAFTPNVGYQVSEDAYNTYTYFDGVNDDVDGFASSFLSNYVSSTWTATIRFVHLGNGASRCIFRDQTGTADRFGIFVESGFIKVVKYDGSYTRISEPITNGYHEVVISHDSGGTMTATLDGVAFSASETSALLSSTKARALASDGDDFYEGFITYINFNDEFGIDNRGESWDDTIGANDGTLNGGTSVYVFDIGASTDLFNGAIPTFVGAAAPNGQLFTGGGVSFVGANTDDITTPIANTDTYTVAFWYDGRTGDENYPTFLSNGSATVFLARSFNTIQIRNGGGNNIVNVATGIDFATAPIHICLTCDDADNGTLNTYIDGVLYNSYDLSLDAQDNATLRSGFINYRGAGSHRDITAIKDMVVINGEQKDATWVANLYNNPNKFVEIAQSEANCLFAYDFNGGTYADGYPVIDVSGNGNHGVVSAGAGDIAVNNLSIGSQTALHGWTEYIIPTGSLDLTTGVTLTNVNDYVETFFQFSYNASTRILDNSGDAGNFLRYDGAASDTIEVRIAFGSVVELNTSFVEGQFYKIRIVKTVATGAHQFEIYVDDALDTTYGLAGAGDYPIDDIGNPNNGIIGYVDLNGTITGAQNGWSNAVGTKTNVIIPSITDIATTDIFGNTVSRAWKAGLLNPTGLQTTLGVLTNSGDLKSRTYGIMTLQIGSLAANASILDNSDANAGINLLQRSNTNMEIRIEDDGGGASSSATINSFVAGGVNNIGGLNISPNGDVDGYRGTDSVAMAFLNSDTSEDVGITGSDDLELGKASTGNYTLPFSVVIYYNHLTLAEQEKLRTKHFNKIIP